MIPDLPTRVREAFATRVAASHCIPSLDAALAAVIAAVQEDRTREIVEWLGDPATPNGHFYARKITREFGGTTHD